MALAFFGLGLRSRSRTLEEIDRATVQEVDDADYRAYLAEREQRLVHLRLSSSAAAHDEAPPKSPGLRDDGKQLSNGKWYSQIKETVIEAEKSQHGDRDDTQQVEVELGLKQAMLDVILRTGEGGKALDGTTAARIAVNSLQRSTRRWLHIDDEGKIRAAQWAPDKLLQQATKSADDDDDNEPQHHDDTAPRNGIREWLWTVTTKPESSRLAWFYSYLMVVVIMLSTVTFVVATLPQFRGDQGALTAFAVIETIVIQVFLLDYLVRLCTCEYGYASEWKNKLRFVVDPYNLIDLFSIVPWYVELGISNGDIYSTGSSAVEGSQVVRVMRLFRIFRLFKLVGRYSKMGVVIRVLASNYEMLLLVVFLLCVGIILFSTVQYYIEVGTWYYKKKCFVSDVLVPTQCSDFQSIPDAFWWSLTSMMSVGYGDKTPELAGGKVIACLAFLVGLVNVALPIGIIGHSFTRVWHDERISETAKRELVARLMPAPLYVEALLNKHNEMVRDLGEVFAAARPEMELLHNMLHDKTKARQLQLDMEECLLAGVRSAVATARAHDNGHAGAVVPASVAMKNELAAEVAQLAKNEQSLQYQLDYLSDLTRAGDLMQGKANSMPLPPSLRTLRYNCRQIDYLAQETKDLKALINELDTALHKAMTAIYDSHHKASAVQQHPGKAGAAAAGGDSNASSTPPGYSATSEAGGDAVEAATAELTEEPTAAGAPPRT